MTDDPALAAVSHRLTQARDLLGDEHMTITASEIIARDTRRRARQWLAAAGAAGAAAGLAAALALAPGSPARPGPGPGHEQLAAWTVQANPDGTVTITMRNASHPAQLQRALARAGVPAVVRWGKICEAGGRGQPLIGGETSFVKNNSPLGPFTGAFTAWPGGKRTLDWSFTVIPSKIPRGGHFVISAMPGPVPAGDFQAVWEFAHTSAPITCAKHVNR